MKIRLKNNRLYYNEMYKAKSGATNGIESIQKNAADDGNYERKEAKSGKPYFVLKAKNKQIIGQSQMYSYASAMEAGIESVRNNAPGASVEDLS